LLEFRNMSARRWFRATLGSALLLLAACGGGGDDTSWLFPLWVPTEVRIADIDGDGRADIVTAAQLSTSLSAREGRVVVRRQTAPGVYAAPQTYVVGMYPWKLVVADMDGDGAPDLVVADAGPPQSGAGAVWLLRQNPADRGSFLPAQRLAVTASEPDGLAVGDVNGDGAPDVVVTSALPGTPGASVLLQNPAQRGSFQAPAAIALPGLASAVAIGDLNGDGRDDLVFRVILSSFQGDSRSTLALVYQQPDGTLAPPVTLAPQSGLNSNSLTLIDLNGDGRQDIVEFLTPCCDGYVARITALLQQSGGAFTQVDTSLAGVRGIDGAAVADLNGNGRPDMAIVGFYPEGSPSTVYSRLNLFWQDGSGAFGLAQSLSLPISASCVAAGDLDGDGLADLAVLGSGNHLSQLLVMRQSAAVPGTFLAPQFLN
jgi:hypothetical protein